jgi:hypothetical protein
MMRASRDSSPHIVERGNRTFHLKIFSIPGHITMLWQRRDAEHYLSKITVIKDMQLGEPHKNRSDQFF